MTWVADTLNSTAGLVTPAESVTLTVVPASVIGPILGGILVEAFGWEWIFFINIPVGVIGFVLAWRLVPTLPTHSHTFDWLGVALSGLGMFFLVFGIQQGHKYHWNAWVMTSIIGGLVIFAIFVYWQWVNKREPLVPLKLFRVASFGVSLSRNRLEFALTMVA